MRPYALKALFRTAVAALLALAFTAPSYGGAVEGKKTFEAKKCGVCHQVQGPAKEKTIKDVLAKKGPELWYAGSKFNKGFLEAWLKDPKPIRPLEYYSLTKVNEANHPKLSQGDATDAALYLMSLKSADVKDAGLKPQDNPRGRVVFLKKQSCYGCHLVRERANTAGGLTGPALIGAGQRLNADWIYAYLANPKAFKPVKDMPVYKGILSDEEMRAVAEYVANLN